MFIAAALCASLALRPQAFGKRYPLQPKRAAEAAVWLRYFYEGGTLTRDGRLLQLRCDGVFRVRGGDGGPARLPAHLRADEPSEDRTDPGGLESRLDACAKTMNARTPPNSPRWYQDRRTARPAPRVRPGPARSRADLLSVNQPSRELHSEPPEVKLLSPL